ncbi:MAG TPA: hypothetical protein VF173_22905 [Thermoanaerobaculia bacterium]|nr:hypothetical protein [Thermoanaerobaculia bacterium]
MQITAKDRQISIRIARETDVWLERRAGSSKNKAGFIRQIIERERAREREQELLRMFNEAAAEVTKEDIEERESLLGGFDTGRLD